MTQYNYLKSQRYYKRLEATMFIDCAPRWLLKKFTMILIYNFEASRIYQIEEIRRVTSSMLRFLTSWAENWYRAGTQFLSGDDYFCVRKTDSLLPFRFFIILPCSHLFLYQITVLLPWRYVEFYLNHLYYDIQLITLRIQKNFS